MISVEQINQESLLLRIQEMWGTLGTEQTLAELLRDQVNAHGKCTRATAIGRLERQLEPLMGASPRENLVDVCTQLERQGDFVVSKGGVLHVTPLRLIARGGGEFLVVTSLPLRRLSTLVSGDWSANGLERSITVLPGNIDALSQQVARLGGVVLGPEAWAGLDRVPAADDAWLGQLETRLRWQAEPAGSLERDDALDWKGLVLGTDGPRWRRKPTGALPRLWRARQSWGRWVSAWTEPGESPATGKFVMLWSDEANRTVFALARAAEEPVRCGLTHEDGRVVLKLKPWLPRAEYRYLSVLARQLPREGDTQCWALSEASLSDVQRILEEQLGLLFVSNGEPTISTPELESEAENEVEQDTETGTAPESMSPTRRDEPVVPERTPDISDELPVHKEVPDAEEPRAADGLEVAVEEEPGALDDTLPIASGMGPLLRRLKLHMYRDMLSFDMKRARKINGVGRKKRAVLRGLAVESAWRDLSDDEARKQVAARKLSDPIADVGVLGPLFRRLGVRTYQDALALELDRAEGLSGVGNVKMRELYRLVAMAQHMMPGAPDDDPAQPNREAEVWPQDKLDPRKLLGRIGGRAGNVMAANDLTTIGKLRRWVFSVDVASVPKYGRTTHAKLVKKLDQLRRDGYESLVFAGPAPNTIQDLAERYLAHLKDRAERVVRGRYQGEMTLQELGDAHDLTRERARQIIETELRLDRESWGDHLRELLEPATALIERCGGVVPLSSVMQALGGPESWALRLSLELEGSDLIQVDRKRQLATLLEPDAFAELESHVRSDCDAYLETHIGFDGIYAILEEHGLTPDATDARILAENWLLLQVDGDQVTRRRTSSLGLYLRALHDLEGPVTVNQVVARVNELEPDTGVLARNVVVGFGRTKQVLSHGHGTWIHVDHLPFPYGRLEALAARCLPQVRAAGGRAVNAGSLLESLRAEGVDCDGVTAHYLRDMLIRPDDIRGWRAGTDVAWTGGTVSRHTITEWIEIVATELEQPFSLAELVAEVAAQSGNLPNSIQAQLGDTTNLITTGLDTYYAIDVLFPTREAFRTAQELVISRLPDDRVVAAPRLAALCPELSDFVKAYGEHMVWGIGRSHDGANSRTRGRLLWRAELGDDVWQVLMAPHLTFPPLLRGRDLRQMMRESYGTPEAALGYGFTMDGVRVGALQRVGSGWYLRASLSESEKVFAIEAEPDVLRLALGGNDFVRSSPSRKTLNQVRVRHGLPPVMEEGLQ